LFTADKEKATEVAKRECPLLKKALFNVIEEAMKLKSDFLNK